MWLGHNVNTRTTQRLIGIPKPGYLHPNPRVHLYHRVQILELDEHNKQLILSDKGPITSRLFQGRHEFTMYATEASTDANPQTRLIHTAAMFGPGLRLPWLIPSMNATFEQYKAFNQALKTEVEERVSAGTT